MPLLNSTVAANPNPDHGAAVRLGDTVYEAIRRIHDHRISAVAVVDDAGYLRGKFSASDAKVSLTAVMPC